MTGVKLLWACAGLTDPAAPLTAAQATTTRNTRDVMRTSWSVRDWVRGLYPADAQDEQLPECGVNGETRLTYPDWYVRRMADIR